MGWGVGRDGGILEFHGLRPGPRHPWTEGTSFPARVVCQNFEGPRGLLSTTPSGFKRDLQLPNHGLFCRLPINSIGFENKSLQRMMVYPNHLFCRLPLKSLEGFENQNSQKCWSW